MILSVITARAGSKGIPGKNYRTIDGRPLFEWSLLASLACPYIDVTVVSTNDPVVTIFAEDWFYENGIPKSKGLVLQRPDELATDTSKNEDALIDAAVQYYWKSKQERGEYFNPTWIVNLQPTSPVRNADLLTQCCETILNAPWGQYDSLFTASKHTPFFYKRDAEGCALSQQHDPCRRPMRQQITPDQWLYHDNGNVYITRADVLSLTRCRIGKRAFVFETTPYQSWQIDYEEDFPILEAMSKVYGAFVDGGEVKGAI